jgi:hypothetical protein
MRFITLLTVITSIVWASMSSYADEHILRFPKSAVNELGAIEKLKVTVACGHISSLHNIPALYDIEMEYDMPTENIFEARPRLGASAVELSRWDGVIAVLSESDGCFAVKVEIEGRTGKSLQWTDRQLGLTK